MTSPTPTPSRAASSLGRGARPSSCASGSVALATAELSSLSLRGTRIDQVRSRNQRSISPRTHGMR